MSSQDPATLFPDSDHLAAWKRLGLTADGLRRLAVRMQFRRGLESAFKTLDVAAARIDQLEAALAAAGLPVPDYHHPSKSAKAIKLAAVMIEAEYSGHDIMTLVWSEYGDEARQAVRDHFTAKQEESPAA